MYFPSPSKMSALGNDGNCEIHSQYFGVRSLLFHERFIQGVPETIVLWLYTESGQKKKKLKYKMSLKLNLWIIFNNLP